MYLYFEEETIKGKANLESVCVCVWKEGGGGEHYNFYFSEYKGSTNSYSYTDVIIFNILFYSIFMSSNFY